MLPTYRLALAALIAVTALAACRRRETAAVDLPTPADTAGPAVNEDSIRAAEEEARRRAEEEARRRADEDTRARMEEMRTTVAAPIYFEFDSDALTDASRATLDSKLAILNANQPIRIRISGHADERGSDEYNLALGQRRAAAAKRYLTQQGIAPDRIEVISYGEERPVAEGSDETAWSQNRRDEFEITAGGDQIALPPSR